MTLTRRNVILGTAASWAVSGCNASLKTPRVPRDLGVVTRQVVSFSHEAAPGTLLIFNEALSLYRILDATTAERYRISTGRPGFAWTGTVRVGRKQPWPTWYPPPEMRKRARALPREVPPGPLNPLGARALYLYRGPMDTLYRIHGTNTITPPGKYETSGCFRLSNADIIELFAKVDIGTKVIVR